MVEGSGPIHLTLYTLSFIWHQTTYVFLHAWAVISADHCVFSRPEGLCSSVPVRAYSSFSTHVPFQIPLS